MEYAPSLALVVGVIVLAILCQGDPDILDGLIKRANETQCVARESH